MTDYDLNSLPENIRSRIKVLGNHWIWIGGTSNTGRKDLKGKIRFNGKSEFVHRLVFHLLTGFDLNSDLQVNHKQECQISLCCHPNCLYAGTQKDNVKDILELGNNFQSNKTHCPLGHEYSTSPTTGQRYCQTCKNNRRNEWRKNKKNEMHNLSN
jgi:Schitoviridae HNH endonuclease